MAQAAVPKYLGGDFQSASPALRFGMYFSGWTSRWKKDNEAASKWQDIVRLNPSDCNRAIALSERQTALFKHVPPASGLEVSAISVSPFATGLGMEHPLENGFAFLNPHGLPYLPGSSVKGVLRRAAEELAHADLFRDDSGWTLPAIWHLFGFEARQSPQEHWLEGFSLDRRDVEKYLDAVGAGDARERIRHSKDPVVALLSERHLHRRGVLAFWDVVPQPKRLDIEVMTPHYSHYYQASKYEGSVTPHDSGKPNPITFLVIPPETPFVFRTTCDVDLLRRIAPELAGDDAWKALLKTAFHHACEWVGFGAKTAVGYGAMRRHPREVERERKLLAEQEAAREQEAKERQRAVAAEEAWHQQQAERDRVQALSHAQRHEEEVDLALREYHAAGQKEAARNELLRLANAPERDADNWPADDLHKAASVIERIFEVIGWHDPGRKPKQRQKQEAKRRAMVERLRSGK